MSTQVLVEKDKLREILERKLKRKILTAKTTIPKIINSITEELNEFIYHPPAKSEIQVTTLSLCLPDHEKVSRLMLAYISDGSGFGNPHQKMKEMFNNNSDDWRTMPRLYELHWLVMIKHDGINLSLNRVNIQYGEDLRPKPYWVEGGRQDPDTEAYCWVPLHGGHGSFSGEHKGGMIPTPVLGVHFNFAGKWFEENVGKNVTCSYPLDLVNDMDGSYDTFRV